MSKTIIIHYQNKIYKLMMRGRLQDTIHSEKKFWKGMERLITNYPQKAVGEALETKIQNGKLWEVLSFVGCLTNKWEMIINPRTGKLEEKH